MKKRRSRPLLRASIAAMGASLLAGVGSTTTAAAEPPKSAVSIRVLNVSVQPPAGFVAAEPGVLTLRTTDGRLLATRLVRMKRGHNKATRIDWKLDKAVELPRRVQVTVVLPADDDPATPSPNDLSATLTAEVDQPIRLFPEVHQPGKTPSVQPVPTKRPEPRPVYANTKGSHHYETSAEPSKPLELDGSDLPSERGASVRASTS